MESWHIAKLLKSERGELEQLEQLVEYKKEKIELLETELKHELREEKRVINDELLPNMFKIN